MREGLVLGSLLTVEEVPLCSLDTEPMVEDRNCGVKRVDRRDDFGDDVYSSLQSLSLNDAPTPRGSYRMNAECTQIDMMSMSYCMSGVMCLTWMACCMLDVLEQLTLSIYREGSTSETRHARRKSMPCCSSEQSPRGMSPGSLTCERCGIELSPLTRELAPVPGKDSLL